MSERPDSSIDPKELDRIERLRDRTDEIELIISGLTTVALFTMPGWLFESLTAYFSHRTQASSQVIEMLLILAPGLFYGLGACFAVHLVIRAYWAGLAGLRSVYPEGIRWDRIPGIGPMTKESYKKRLPDLSHAIASSDHAASTLFSVISMIALGMLWISILILGIIMAAQLLGPLVGDVDQALDILLIIMITFFVGPPMLIWVLDAFLARRIPDLKDRPWVRGVVDRLNDLYFWLWPQRLILPVQLTLQSNTRPRLFNLLVIIGTAVIVLIGFWRYEAWTEFTLSNQFVYMDNAAIGQGIDSAHYEHLRGPRDRLRPVPTIHHFEQRSAFVRVFLPYFPRRDNLVLDAHCADQKEPMSCLRSLWSVALGDRVLDTAQLLPTERRDLNQRGLTGVLPLTGLAPGLHRLDIVWNPAGASVDSHTFTIPFLFTPDQELNASLNAPSRDDAGQQEL